MVLMPLASFAGDLFGEPMPAQGNPMGLDESIASLQENKSITGKFKGEITQVCQKKGCWMILVGEDSWARVTFKDYGFFVPTESGGRQSVVYGELTANTLPGHMAKHYAEDAGVENPSADPIDEYAIVASSVVISKD